MRHLLQIGGIIPVRLARSKHRLQFEQGFLPAAEEKAVFLPLLNFG